MLTNHDMEPIIMTSEGLCPNLLLDQLYLRWGRRSRQDWLILAKVQNLIVFCSNEIWDFLKNLDVMYYELTYLYIVCNPNQVSVSGTETKVQFRYRYWSQFYFLQKPKLFFSKVFQIFSCFSASQGNKSFESLKLNTDLQK